MAPRPNVYNLTSKNNKDNNFGVEIQTVFKTTDNFKRKKWILTVAFIA